MSTAMQQWGGETTDDERLWALLAHLSTFVVPLPAVGPLIVYMIKKEESTFVKYHAVQGIIFQLIAWAIAGVTCGVGLILFALPIWLAVRAYNGEWAGYPLIESMGAE